MAELLTSNAKPNRRHQLLVIQEKRVVLAAALGQCQGYRIVCLALHLLGTRRGSCEEAHVKTV